MAKDIELIDITPALAHEYLGANTHNRNLRQSVVLAYAADMAEGNWRWNGESIKFAADGTLLDGQHRLAAIAESGKTVPALVVRGLPPVAQETVDGGAKRKFADVLKLRGESDANVLAAVTRRVTIWETGARASGSKTYAPTNAQLLQTLEKYPWLREVARAATNISTHCSLPASLIGLGWWLFSQISAEDNDFFFARLADFQGLTKGDAIWNVRGRRSEAYLTAILIKAWNAYRDGTTVGVLTYRPGGARPEKFPEPH